jgi:hypothetical protein
MNEHAVKARANFSFYDKELVFINAVARATVGSNFLDQLMSLP